VKKEPRRKWGIPSVGSSNASVVNDSLTRCESILFHRKKKRPSEKRKIRPAFLWPSIFAFATDLPMILLFLPLSPRSISLVFSPSRFAAKKFRSRTPLSLSLCLSLSLFIAHYLKYSALFSPQLPLICRKSRCILGYIPRKRS